MHHSSYGPTLSTLCSRPHKVYHALALTACTGLVVSYWCSVHLRERIMASSLTVCSEIMANSHLLLVVCSHKDEIGMGNVIDILQFNVAIKM